MKEWIQEVSAKDSQVTQFSQKQENVEQGCFSTANTYLLFLKKDKISLHNLRMSTVTIVLNCFLGAFEFTNSTKCNFLRFFPVYK